MNGDFESFIDDVLTALREIDGIMRSDKKPAVKAYYAGIFAAQLREKCERARNAHEAKTKQ